MASGGLVECSFFIPLRRDANLSDGELHPPEAWDWLDNELYVRFKGGTVAPGQYRGSYEDPDTHQRVADDSLRFSLPYPKRNSAGCDRCSVPLA